MRLPPQELQKPRFLQEYGSSRFLPHCVHRRRKKPNSFMPHLRKDRNSSSTNPGTARSLSCCLARNVSNCSATTRYSRLSSGCRGAYSSDVTCTPLQDAYEKPNEDADHKGVLRSVPKNVRTFQDKSNRLFRAFGDFQNRLGSESTPEVSVLEILRHGLLLPAP